MRFSDLEPGQWFLAEKEDDIYLKVFGHNLQSSFNEGQGGHAVMLKNGEICFFHDHEHVNLLEVNPVITDCF